MATGYGVLEKTVFFGQIFKKYPFFRVFEHFSHRLGRLV